MKHSVAERPEMRSVREKNENCIDVDEDTTLCYQILLLLDPTNTLVARSQRLPHNCC